MSSTTVQAEAASQTTTETVQPGTSTAEPTALTLRLAPTEPAPRVRWAEDTVDNEFMGKKKSKCCCIFKKKREWNEQSDDEDSDCETGNCRGHVEKKHD